MAQYTASPGFDFALDTGRQAIERRMSASGMRNSGNTLAELMKYGTGLALQDYGNWEDRNIRREGLDVTRRGQDQNFGLGMFRAGNDYSLGREQNANTLQNNLWNYDLGSERNRIDAADSENRYNLGVGQQNLNWFNADTSRGNALSDSFYRGEENQRKWMGHRSPWV